MCHSIKLPPPPPWFLTQECSLEIIQLYKILGNFKFSCIFYKSKNIMFKITLKRVNVLQAIYPIVSFYVIVPNI